MAFSITIQETLQRYREEIQQALKDAVARVIAAFEQPGTLEYCAPATRNLLTQYYGQMRYHLGWVDADLRPTSAPGGKLLRPTLLLLAYEAAGAWEAAASAEETKAHLRRALPAAAAIELTHNFTLIHDDIVDEDSERHHRPTVWKLWGVPQAINSGDGMFALSRLALWEALTAGVEPALAARLAALLDRTCLTVAEGQYLDMIFETRLDVSLEAYYTMIRRKTAALMACAAEMGALLGTRDTLTIARLRSFGEAIGLAFQLRDDLLGVWASSAELGKTPAGDLYRRKKSLPFLHAFSQAEAADRRLLEECYQQNGALSPQQVESVLAVFERTGTRAYCRTCLAEQCQTARLALATVPPLDGPLARRARADLETLVDFVEAASRD